MYNNEWIKELNESYSNNIRNTQDINEIVLTEEQLTEHFETLAMIVESIERTFDIELTEEEIDQLDEQLQLNEFIGVLARLGVTAAKRGIGLAMKHGGQLAQKGYKAKRTKAIADAAKATEDAASSARAAWRAGGFKGPAPLVKPIKPDFPKKGFGTRLAQKAELKGKEWTPSFSKPGGAGKRGFVGSTVRQAGYKSGWGATKAAGKQTGMAIGALATGAAAGYTLGNALKGPESPRGGRGSRTSRGKYGEYDTDWGTESGYRRPTGVREEYLFSLTEATNQMVENLYNVRLNEFTKNNLISNLEESYFYYLIEKMRKHHSEIENPELKASRINRMQWLNNYIHTTKDPKKKARAIQALGTVGGSAASEDSGRTFDGSPTQISEPPLVLNNYVRQMLHPAHRNNPMNARKSRDIVRALNKRITTQDQLVANMKKARKDADPLSGKSAWSKTQDKSPKTKKAQASKDQKLSDILRARMDARRALGASRQDIKDTIPFNTDRESNNLPW